MKKEFINTLKPDLLIGSLLVNILFGYIIHLYTQDDKNQMRVKKIENIATGQDIIILPAQGDK